MKKLFIIILMLTLVACSSRPTSASPPTELSGMKVIEKHTTRWSYIIRLEKNGEQIELKTNKDTMYNAIQSGTTINVSYDNDFYIINIQFPKLK